MGCGRGGPLRGLLGHPGHLPEAGLRRGATITTIIAVRFILAALLLLAVIRRRGLDLRLSRRQLWQVLAMGAVGYGGMSVLFAQGLRSLSASMAGMLLYTYPAMVTALAVALRVERPDPWKGLALLVCLSGHLPGAGGARRRRRHGGRGGGLRPGRGPDLLGLHPGGNRVLRELDPLVAASTSAARPAPPSPCTAWPPAA